MTFAIDQFTVTKKDGVTTLSAELSDLELTWNGSGVFHQIYPDAADIGLTIRGKYHDIQFYIAEQKQDNEGELMSYILNPTLRQRQSCSVQRLRRVMKKNEVKIGSVYAAKVSDKLVPVRITSVSIYGGWDAQNLQTKRDVRIRGAQRLRCELEKNLETGKWRPANVDGFRQLEKQPAKVED